MDYPDKELSILPAEDWPYFAPYRDLSRAHGTRFVGRLEATTRRDGVLVVRHYWPEAGVRHGKRLSAALNRAVARFAAFHGCTEIQMDEPL